MKDKFLQIINHYGIDKQLKYIHSEYFELDEAIIIRKQEGDNFSSYTDELENHIAEELADIQVMLKQFQYYYGIEDKQIEEIMKYKIDRQLERIENEKREN